jgi:hypothetical protein
VRANAIHASLIASSTARAPGRAVGSAVALLKTKGISAACAALSGVGSKSKL